MKKLLLLFANLILVVGCGRKPETSVVFYDPKIRCKVNNDILDFDKVTYTDGDGHFVLRAQQYSKHTYLTLGFYHTQPLEDSNKIEYAYIIFSKSANNSNDYRSYSNEYKSLVESATITLIKTHDKTFAGSFSGITFNTVTGKSIAITEGVFSDAYPF